MPRGTPLTPQQTERAAQVFAETGSYEAAAEAIGSSRSVVRRALLRSGESQRVTLHARAARRGERLGRAIVERNLRRCDAMLVEHVDVPRADNRPPTLEPADQGVYMREARLALRVLVTLNDSLEKRRTQRLERKKTREEIKLLEKKTGGARNRRVLSPGDAEYTQLVQERFGGPRQGYATVGAAAKKGGGTDGGR